MFGVFSSVSAMIRKPPAPSAAMGEAIAGRRDSRRFPSIISSKRSGSLSNVMFGGALKSRSAEKLQTSRATPTGVYICLP